MAQNSINETAIPEVLRVRNQWIVWRAEPDKDKPGKINKTPYDAKTGEYARSTDPTTWTDYQTACNTVPMRDMTGIGYVFAEDDPYVGIDLDDCIVDGQMLAWASVIVADLNSYTEISPSGCGVKIWVVGDKPPTGINLKGEKVPQVIKPADLPGGVEIYGKSRYFTVTGQHYPGTPDSIEYANGTLEALISVCKPPDILRKTTTHTIRSTNRHAADWAEKTMQDAEKMLHDAASGEYHATRVAAGKLAGGIVAHGLICADEAIQRLYDARPPQAHAVKELKAIQDGVEYGISEPLELPVFPTDQDIVIRDTIGHCPKCDTKIQRSKHLYRGTAEKGWYCPQCKHPMIWPYDAYTPTTQTDLHRKPTDAHEPVEQGDENLPTYNTTDAGNGERFAAQHRGNARYVAKANQWILWTGKTWQRDECNIASQLALKTARSILAEATEQIDGDKRKALAKWSFQSESRDKLSAMLSTASWQPGMTVSVDDLDADPYLLNVENGMVNLKTGALSPHDKEKLCTTLLHIPYDPGAACPIWLAFLDEIFDGDAELIAFLQRAAGYTLTGSTDEQIFFFLYGTGSNGKSTFLSILEELLNGLSYRIQAETLIASKNRREPYELAELPGKRMVIASELEGRPLNEGLVKDLTGNERLPARAPGGKPYQFDPQFKLWMYGNHKPEIRGMDNGIWRRVLTVPFNVKIPDAEKDPQLKAKLKGELPGILAWCIAGAREWAARGLCVPAKVYQATETYKAEMDTIGAFIADRCVAGKKETVSAKDLYEAYKEWCIEAGEHILSQKRLSPRLKERGYNNTTRDSNGRTQWTGVRLRTPSDTFTEPSEPSEPLVALSHEKNNDNENTATKGSNGSEGSVTSTDKPALTADVMHNGIPDEPAQPQTHPTEKAYDPYKPIVRQGAALPRVTLKRNVAPDTDQELAAIEAADADMDD